MIWYGGRTMVKSRRTPFGANSFLSSRPPGLARFQYAIVPWHEPLNSSGSSETTESGILSETKPGAT